jgi:hypothetical protein
LQAENSVQFAKPHFAIGSTSDSSRTPATEAGQATPASELEGESLLPIVQQIHIFAAKAGYEPVTLADEVFIHASLSRE